jgi:hypothetical protein
MRTKRKNEGVRYSWSALNARRHAQGCGPVALSWFSSRAVNRFCERNIPQNKIEKNGAKKINGSGVCACGLRLR